MTKTIYNSAPVVWKNAQRIIPYPDAVRFMENYIEQIQNGKAQEMVWVLEHPALYTAGTSAKQQDLISPDKFPVFKTGRGGQYTYHGPGQMVVYLMLDLKTRGRDVRAFVHALEQLIITTLADFGIKAVRREKRIGVWVEKESGGEAKIAAIGVRIKRWVSMHGISININPNLEHFSGIVPCGITEHGVTSLHALGAKVSWEEVEAKLKQNFKKLFGPIK